MKNPTKRNRNIGTAIQGYGQNNKFTIPEPFRDSKIFYERLVNYKKLKRTINGHEFLFVIEQTRESAVHACSIKDLETIIENIPSKDYGHLTLIILRQPKRKEEILSPTWGRLIYSFEFENDFFPAIILDAIDCTKKLKWPSKLCIDSQKELERLKEDGHIFEYDGRNFIADFEIENVRNTQLYRTLPHEFGHYVQYLDYIERDYIAFLNKTDDENNGETFETFDVRRENYFKIPKAEKEKFAHKYAEDLKTELVKKKIIPFDTK
jgi:hypothetical protein